MSRICLPSTQILPLVMRERALAQLKLSFSRTATRDTELAGLSDLWQRGERVVTIHGPAGIGKTRLATEWVLGLCRDGHFPQALYCPSAQAPGLDGLLRLLAQSMGVALPVGAFSLFVRTGMRQLGVPAAYREVAARHGVPARALYLLALSPTGVRLTSG